MNQNKVNYKHIFFSGLGIIAVAFTVYFLVTTLAEISEREQATDLSQDEQGDKVKEHPKDEEGNYVMDVDEDQYLKVSRDNLKQDTNYRYTVTMPDYINEIQNTTGDYFVYYYSPVCSHCLETTPSLIKGLDSAKGTVGEDFTFSQVDVTINPEIYYPLTEIKGTPTLVKYVDGVEIYRVSGSGYPDSFYKDIFDNNEQINEYVDLTFKDYNLREQIETTEFVSDEELEKIIKETETEENTDVK